MKDRSKAHLQIKPIVISAINFFEAGPLSILKDCLKHLDDEKYLGSFRIIALVHRKELFLNEGYNNIEFLEFPKSRSSYFFRLYYEYIYFKKFADENNVFFWLSLHDITPNVGDIRQAVYCHNASPFTTLRLDDIYVQPTFFLFSLFYKYLYSINIKKNKYVIVQQLWIKEKFHEIFDLPLDKLIVAKPQVPEIPRKYLKQKDEHDEKIFFFPTFPRPFKNIEVICEAVKILNADNIKEFKVLITINGTENRYSNGILKQYHTIPNIHFIGLLKREDVCNLYAECDCLIFPSKLESWGLPISEFKQYNKPMLVCDLPYSRETVGDYEKAVFFKSSNPNQLALYMSEFIKSGSMPFKRAEPTIYPAPFAQNWDSLFSLLLDDDI